MKGLRSSTVLLVFCLTLVGFPSEVSAQSSFPEGPLAFFDTYVRSQIQGQLRGDADWVWKALEKSQHEFVMQTAPDTNYRMMLKAGRTIASTRGDTRLAWMLAVDLLANRMDANWWRYSQELSAEGKRRKARLEKLGLSYYYDDLGAAWVYRRSLLRGVWKTVPHSRWGEIAFTLLLRDAAYTRVLCRKGTSLFNLVIRKGERFLRDDHPETVHDVVTTIVAQAYETRWSLSRMGPKATYRDYIDMETLSDTPSRDRNRAIALYRSVASKDSLPKKLRTYASTKAKQLARKIDTEQRLYICAYD